MKRHLLIILVIIMLILCVAMLAGCDMFKGSQNPDDEKISFTVTFDTQGGSSIAPITIGEGKAITLPQTPTKEGYIFDGWYLDDSFVEQFNETQTISANITVYAKWRLPNTNEVYISFDTDGGSEINGYYAITGTTITLPSAPKKQGFDFETWKYGDETYAAGAEFLVPNEYVQFVALWLSQNLRHVTFETNGGSDIEQSVVEDGSKLTAPKHPKRPGYLFGGWYKDKDCTVLWDFDKDSVTESITLYAKWNIDVVGISSVEGASIDGTNIFMAVDKDVEFVELAEKVILSSNAYWNLYYDRLGQTKIPTKIAANKDSGTLNKKGNTFYILVTSEDGLQEKLYTLTIYRRITISVQYYDVYGNELYTTEMDNYNTISEPFDYNPQGYTLRGWKYNYTETGTKGFVFGDNGTVVTNENKLKLYPKATVNSYKVNLQVGSDETVSKDTVYVSYDSSITLPVPTKTGYSFVGWYYGSMKVTSNMGYCSQWTYAQDVALTPQWKINSYKVTLSSNISGGTLNGGGLHEYNSKVTILATTNVGYVWLGWFEGETKLTDDVQYVFTMKDADRQFTAKWSKITLENNISAAGSVEVQNASKVGENVTVKATTNIGYTFIGWFEGEVKLSDEQEYTFKATAQNKTLTAKWELNKEMAGFTFSSTPTICTITGVTDNSITTITIPDSVTNIGGMAFSGCGSLTTVNWNATACTRAGDYASPIFKNCSKLTTINIGDNVTAIPSYAFYGCSGLTSITIPDSVTSIGSDAFSGCTGLTSITIPDSVTTIGSYVFENCSGLTSVTIPDSVTHIGGWAFRGCTGLTSITIPNSVTYIDDGPFHGCSNLTTVNWNATACIKGSSSFPTFFSCTNLTTINIGKNVTTIPSYVFRWCFGLTSITIPDSVTSIGDGAFYECTGLTSISIPDSVTSIGSAFSSCTGLTSVTIGNSVTSIGDYAFSGCSGLTSVTIPDSVTRIGNGAFRGCTGLTRIDFTGTIAQWNQISKGGWWHDNVPSSCKVVCTDGTASI